METHKRLILLGPPASGKGTQARFLSELFDVPTLSTGAMLRREMELNTETGQKARKYMDDGKFVPDSLVNEMVKEWIVRLEGNAFLLDGYPRTLTQAETLQTFLEEECGGLHCVVWMDVSREVIEDRIKHRIECGSCHFISQGEEGSTCTKCGAGIMRTRKDDALDRFAVRWKDFEDLTLPVARYYEDKGLVVKVTVDTERNVSDVSEELLAKLKEFFKN